MHLLNISQFVKCVARIVAYIVSSQKRILALGDHLTRLASSFEQSSQQAFAALRCLHLLGAVFAGTDKSCRVVTQDAKPAVFFASNISVHAVKLMEIAVSNNGHGLEAAATHKQIHTMLQSWKETQTFTRSLRIKLREVARMSYDTWLSWLKDSYPDYYEKTKHLSTGNHSHTTQSSDAHDDSWYNAPVSSMIPHIRGQRAIKAAAMDPSTTWSIPLDPEMEAVVSQHISEVAKIFAGPNAARFTPEDNVTLNGLGQPISIESVTGSHKRKVPAYYGMMENCAKSFKKAREELPALVQVSDPAPQPAFSSRHVPPPMDTDSQRFSGSYPPSSTGPARGGPSQFGGAHDGGSNGWRGGSNSWAGERGRGGYGGRGGAAAGGRGRGRGGWGGRDW